MNKNKNILLKIINKNPGITFSELINITSFSKSTIFYHIKNLENDKLIIKYYNKTYKLHPTKLGKEIYLQNKIKFLLDNNIIREENAIAPCICDGCIYFNDKLIEFCDSIECNNNKIFVAAPSIKKW